MGRTIVFLYGIASYLLFLAAFLYAIGFVGGLGVPKNINSGQVIGLFPSLAINLLLLSIFAIQHSVMARPWFKRVWVKIIPKSAERSTYILLTSAALFLIFAYWQPMPETIWDVRGTNLGMIALAVFWFGWFIVLTSTFMIDHFDLLGLKQVYSQLVRREFRQSGFRKMLFYRLVRHPIMSGFVIAFWVTPVMTIGHLLFACVTTAYIYIAVIYFEEKDLAKEIGEDYKSYQQEVGSFIPGIGKKSAAE